ncbi:VOC family protein [Gorillibacterium timonense]|uniref:VOC family protein n=1 Tax=Gorillibacterium timonense TaxID=1689269 RepID=UPI00071CC9A1|nr:VOC family protein [Gorillibacterium timonense]
MKFNGICLITDDVPGMAAFYKDTLQVEAEGDETTARIHVEGAILDLCSRSAMESLAPGSTEGIGRGGFSIELEVVDTDAVYERLKDKAVLVKPPQTYPWGRRSVWFRDPDGNVLNFFSNR